VNWATAYIEKLARGETVAFRPRGNSMQPRIQSGQLCTVEPLGTYVPKPNDIVLCRVKGNAYLHLISAVKHETLYQISNAKGHVNGWISRQSIYGRLVKVEP
jgi:hypothetical protein